MSTATSQLSGPPNSQELEQELLSCFLLDHNVIERFALRLHRGLFYYPAHQLIWGAIQEVVQSNKTPDVILLREFLKRKGQLDEIGGTVYLEELLRKSVSAWHAEAILNSLEELARRRFLFDLGQNTLSLSQDPNRDSSETIEQLRKQLDAYENHLITEPAFYDIADYQEEAFQVTLLRMQSKSGITGLSTGFSELDNITNGWEPGKLYIVAARPGMGKTAFELTSIHHLAIEQNIPVGLFSLEMDRQELNDRFWSIETEIELQRIARGTLNSFEFQRLQKTRYLRRERLIIDDSAYLTFNTLQARARHFKKKYGIQALFIDYLQLLSIQTASYSNREQEISQISRGLKAIAKSLRIPVIALSQLSRTVENRGEKRPQLSDLRESGAIEQDANMVGFLYRPEYYKMTVDADGNSTQGIAEFIVAKNRGGNTSSTNLKFIGKYAKFANLEDMQRYPKEWWSSHGGKEEIEPSF